MRLDFLLQLHGGLALADAELLLDLGVKVGHGSVEHRIDAFGAFLAASFLGRLLGWRLYRHDGRRRVDLVILIDGAVVGIE